MLELEFVVVIVFDDDEADWLMTANCVLSPSSARKIRANVLKKKGPIHRILLMCGISVHFFSAVTPASAYPTWPSRLSANASRGTSLGADRHAPCLTDLGGRVRLLRNVGRVRRTRRSPYKVYEKLKDENPTGKQ